MKLLGVLVVGLALAQLASSVGEVKRARLEVSRWPWRVYGAGLCRPEIRTVDFDDVVCVLFSVDLRRMTFELASKGGVAFGVECNL